MSLAEWIELPFVVVLYLPYLILGGIFDLFSGNMYASSDVKVFGTIFILLALFVGSVLWILLSTKILKRTQKKYKRILLYCFQFPSVWFVSTSLSILLVIPFVILLIFVRVRDEVGVLDSICIATFFIGLFPVLFYKLIWRHRKKKEVINH
jgi:hypothetical protein